MPSKSRLSDFVPYLMSITSNAVSGRIAEEYRVRYGLRVPEWRVMAVLGDNGALTQRDLTALTLMDKVAVNRACKELEERGLAAREPNRSDGRSHLLELTPEGIKVHDQVMPLVTEMERRLLERFEPAEVEGFKDMLARIREEVRELNADGIETGIDE